MPGRDGIVRYIGLCEIPASELRRAHSIHPIAAVQVEYSVLDLTIERIELFQAARELGVTIVSFSPLGRGLLTSEYVRQTLNDIGG